MYPAHDIPQKLCNIRGITISSSPDYHPIMQADPCIQHSSDRARPVWCIIAILCMVLLRTLSFTLFSLSGSRTRSQPVKPMTAAIWLIRDQYFDIKSYGPQFNIKMSSYQYLDIGIFYTGKMSYLYWVGALVTFYFRSRDVCSFTNRY